MSKSAVPDQEGRPHDKLLVRGDFAAELARLTGEGWRLDAVYPADEPHSAMLSKAGAALRLTSRPDADAPAGRLPPFQPEFRLTRGAGGAGAGRAGMRYRDLIPGRLGGRYIASHITIAGGGPVDDWVHYHAVALQMIYVARGWVRVVYEDQGEPFVMQAGDLVLQPPFIRHRVLDSAPGLEVIEIGCPALHTTYSDHELGLPNGAVPERLFAGQRFLRHVAADTPWTPFCGGQAQETAMRAATAGLADVRTIRILGQQPICLPAHDGELSFGYVLSGTARLDHGEGHALGSGDAIVIPPDEAWALANASPDFRLLHVTTAPMPAEIPAGPDKSA